METPKTKLRELYTFVGPEAIRELPSLRQGAQNWFQKAQRFPSLSTITNEQELARWAQQNPNSGVSLSDWQNYEKFIRYQNLFPQGASSESLQQRLYAESISDQAPTKPLRHAAHSGHFNIDFFTKMLEAKGLDQDPHFKRILKNVINEHNRLNPNNQFSEKVIIKSGKDKILNPTLPQEFISKAKEVFGDAYGEKQLHALENKESSRVYKTQSNDPVLKKIREAIESDAASTIEQKQTSGQKITKEEELAIRRSVAETHSSQFAKDYPEKAQAYARRDPFLREAVKRQRKLNRQQNKITLKHNKEIKKIYKNVSEDPTLQRLATRIDSQTAIEVGKRRSEIAEKARTTYAYSAPRVDENAIRSQFQSQEFDRWVRENPKKAATYAKKDSAIKSAYERYLQQEEQRRQEEEQQAQLRSLRDPSIDSQLTAIRDKYPNRATDPIQQKEFEKEMERFAKNNERVSRRKYKNDQEIKAAQKRLEEKQKQARQYGKRQGLGSRLSKRIEKLAERAKYAQTDYWSTRARQKALSGLKTTFRALRTGGRYGAEAGIKGAAAAPAKITKAFRPAFPSSRIATGGISGVRAVAPAIVGLSGSYLFWGVLAFLIFFFLILIWFGGDEGNNENNISVSITKIGPTAVPNPSEQTPTELTYTLNVSYTGNPTQINVVDELPDEVEIVEGSISNNGTYNPNNHTVTWSIPITNTNGSTPQPGGEIPGGGGEAPNANNCNSTYNLSQNPIGQNFGDPSCNFTLDGLYALLEQEDPENADYWFNTVIPCESPGYDPNLYYRTGAAGDTPDEGGAWGLFQMGSSLNGAGTPGSGLNGPYDRGDVPWQQQVTNAVNYKDEVLNGGWRYWACANDRW